jgi:hypothetical protein
MHVDPQRLVNALLRCQLTSFVARSFAYLNPGAAFARNWHLEAIAYQLDRVERGEIRRLIINLPPRSLKSLIVSVAWPAYLLGRNPRRRIIAISYGDDLALKHAAECRALLHSAWYQAAFPQAQIRRSTAGEMVTTARGCRKATSVRGALTGFGGDLIIIDDPLKPADALSATKRNAVNHWFANTLLSRLDHKESGAIVIVMQRVHLDDLGLRDQPVR